jgi:hypothetical protein
MPCSHRKPTLLFVFLAFWLSGFAANPEKIILADQGKSSYSIVLCPDADSNDRNAATLLQQYFRRATGVSLAITGKNQKEKHAIYLASRGREQGLPYRVPSYQLKEEGYLVSTFGEDILIFGGGGKGLQYGVARFLEKYMGCRKFSDTEELVPSVNTLAIHPSYELQNPAFQYRSNSTRDRSYIDWHGLNTHGDVWGMFVHTFDRLIPPDEYFATHPEYFSLLPAGRVPDAQLCLSNKEVLKIIILKLSEKMKQQADKKYWSVSQNDTYSPCGCKDCRRLDSLYGGPSGTMIWFVNQVAEAFPDKEISTLAYQYTRSAPKNIIPAKNVNIFLCSIECDRSKPLTEHPNGKPFVKDVQEWSKLTNNIMIWDYIIRYRSMLSPFPNFPVLQPNLQFFRDMKIPMVFEQGPGRLGSSEFSELRSMITAKLLWNPDLDVDSLITDFCDNYYGKGGPMIHAYINKMNSELKASGEDLGIYGTPRPTEKGYLGNENLSAYAALFDQAEIATAADPVTLERVRIARLPLIYAQLEIAKILGVQPGGFYTINAEGKYEVRKDLLQLLDTFDIRCSRHKIKALHEMGLNPKEYYAGTIRYLMSNYQPNLAFGLTVSLDPPASKSYSKGNAQILSDGLVGLDDYNLNWIGWEGEDMNATIDLGKMSMITKISVNFAQDINSWIFMPQEVEFLFSEDGKAYQSAGIVKSTTDPKKGGFISETYAKDVQAVTRYIRIRALNQKTCPLWHKGAGGRCWIFADEIRVK